MEKAGKTQGRVTVKAYCDLPEGHRTTLVVGMSDMLENISAYFDYKTGDAFKPLLAYAGQYQSGDLRSLFDKYLAERHPDETIAVASSFLSMLIVSTQALNRPNVP